MVARGLTFFNDALGHGSSSDAEWRALAFALEMAQQLGARDVRLVGDARTVVEQARGRWPCRGEAAQAHLASVRQLVGGFDRVRLRHVVRSHNLAGIALERRRAVAGQPRPKR